MCGWENLLIPSLSVPTKRGFLLVVSHWYKKRGRVSLCFYAQTLPRVFFLLHAWWKADEVPQHADLAMVIFARPRCPLSQFSPLLTVKPLHNEGKRLVGRTFRHSAPPWRQRAGTGLASGIQEDLQDSTGTCGRVPASPDVILHVPAPEIQIKASHDGVRTGCRAWSVFTDVQGANGASKHQKKKKEEA